MSKKRKKRKEDVFELVSESSDEQSSDDDDPLFQESEETLFILEKLKKETHWTHIEFRDPVTKQKSMYEPLSCCGLHFVIPLSLLQHPELFHTGIFTNHTWKSILSSREREFLKVFLPSNLSSEEKDKLVETLFTNVDEQQQQQRQQQGNQQQRRRRRRELIPRNPPKKKYNFHFGNPVDEFVEKILLGYYHPFVVKRRDHNNYLRSVKASIDKKIYENNVLHESVEIRRQLSAPSSSSKTQKQRKQKQSQVIIPPPPPPNLNPSEK